jgi:hypothetical protein
MRIMLAVRPDVSRRLLVHAVTHDVGEMGGDIPYPGKKNDQVLKDRMEILESQIHAKMTEQWGVPRRITLDYADHRFFKMCEYIEMWEWGLHELALGNKYGQLVALRMIQAAGAICDTMDDTTQAAVKRYCDRRQQQEGYDEHGPHEISRDSERGGHSVRRDERENVSG